MVSGRMTAWPVKRAEKIPSRERVVSDVHTQPPLHEVAEGVGRVRVSFFSIGQAQVPGLFACVQHPSGGGIGWRVPDAVFEGGAFIQGHAIKGGRGFPAGTARGHGAESLPFKAARVIPKLRRMEMLIQTGHAGGHGSGKVRLKIVAVVYSVTGWDDACGPAILFRCT